MKIVEFLKEHPTDWKELLEKKPYSLIIKIDENLVLFNETLKCSFCDFF